MNHRQQFLRCLSLLGVGIADAALASQFLAAEPALQTTAPAQYSVTLADGTQVTLEKRPLIRLRDQQFDPLLTTPATQLGTLRSHFSSAAQTPASATESRTWIVQFDTQAFTEHQSKIRRTGARIFSPFPDHALLVSMTAAQKEKVAGIKGVRWIGEYLIDYKLDGAAKKFVTAASGRHARFSVLLHHRDLGEAFLKSLQKSGLEPVLKTDMGRYEFDVTDTELLRIAGCAEVMFIDPAPEYSEDIDLGRELLGANFLESAVIPGYAGEGVGLETIDKGFLTSHQEFQLNPLLVHGSAAAGSAGADHGTQIAGILFASGVSAKHRGLLPKAARPIVASRYVAFPNGQPNGKAEWRKQMAELTDPKGPYRAVVQTSSWGATTTTQYTTVSAELDEVLFELDIVRTQSQSNTGNRDSRPEAWAKNSVSVGGIRTKETLNRSDDSWTAGASIGPASDGRIKPDLSGPYDAVNTTGPASNAAYLSTSGTSFSTPMVAGYFGLFHQMWADGVFDGGPGKTKAPLNRDVFASRPHASLAKAMLINSAWQYSFSGTTHDLGRTKQGWGFPDLKNLYQLAQTNNWQMPLLVNESRPIQPLETHRYSLHVGSSPALRVTLVYSDPAGNPAAAVHRVNDLSLRLIAPDGTIWWGNNGLMEGNWSTPGGTANVVDTVENVFVQNPLAGTWQVEVLGSEIVKDAHVETTDLDADYALVASGTGASNNTAPTVNAGADLQARLPADGSVSVVLEGQISDDGKPQTGSLSSQWSRVSGPAAVSFSNAAAPRSTATFTASGSYTLRLSASDGELSGSDELRVNIVANQPPQAAFTYSADKLAVRFANSSTDADGSISSYAWSFGDGSSSTLAHPVKSYGKAGSYDVELTVTDNDGARHSHRVTVTVSDSNALPVADFRVASNALTASFTDHSSDSDGHITAWLWTFGDGSSSTLQNPVKTWAAANTYTVQLTVTDDKGGSANTSRNVSVAPANQAPVAAFSFTGKDLSVQFSDLSRDADGRIAAWHWAFGDGSSSTLQNPAKIFAKGGTYKTTLTVTDDKGANHSQTQDVTVTAPSGGNSVLQQSTQGGNKIDVKPGQRGAQSFKHGSNGTYTVSKLSLFLSRESTAPNADLLVDLSDTANGTPISGSRVNVTAASVSNTSAGSSFQKVTLTLPTPVTLNAGQTYYLNLSSTASNGKPYYMEYSSGSTAYANGSYFKNGANDGKDLRFEIIGQ